jgi:hypothetical protein
LFSQHGNRVRNPHRQRVAIKRHEFLEQSTVASAITSGVANRTTVQPTVSSSLLAPVRGATACSAVAGAMREPRGFRVVSFHDTIGIPCLARISPVIREYAVWPRIALRSTAAWSRCSSAWTPTCTTLQETV